MEGRGFVLIRGLPRERYSNDDMCLAYWGIGAHLGTVTRLHEHVDDRDLVESPEVRNDYVLAAHSTASVN